MKSIKLKLINCASGINRLNDRITQLNYITTLEHLTSNLNGSLNSYQQALPQLMNVIYTAREGRMHTARKL